MKPIGVEVLRDTLKAVLAKVARGERFLVTRRGKPLAEIHPVGTNDALARKGAS